MEKQQFSLANQGYTNYPCPKTHHLHSVNITSHILLFFISVSPSPPHRSKLLQGKIQNSAHVSILQQLHKHIHKLPVCDGCVLCCFTVVVFFSCRFPLSLAIDIDPCPLLPLDAAFVCSYNDPLLHTCVACLSIVRREINWLRAIGRTRVDWLWLVPSLFCILP